MQDQKNETLTSDIRGPSHCCVSGTEHDRGVPEIDLLSPLSIGGLQLRNRIVMSPMCQYSAEEGMANGWHLVQLGSRAAGGVSLVMVEATAVTPDGRISPGDLGIWTDAHAEPLARIARFIRFQGAAAGIRLAHAGRKASHDLPWHGGAALKPGQGGSNVIAPSSIPFDDADPPPVALDEAGILCRRLKDVGVDLIDVSSGGMTPKARIPVGKGYQVPFARRIRAEAGLKTGAVGLVTEPSQANEIITGGDADLVFLAQELLREPYWALNAQTELGGEPLWPIQYGYAVKRR